MIVAIVLAVLAVLLVGLFARGARKPGKLWSIQTTSCRTGTGALGGASIAKGTLTNRSGLGHYYVISAAFGYNGASIDSAQWASAALSVDAGSTEQWTVIYNHAGAVGSIACRGAVMAVDGLKTP